ncbi:hypothetical protein Ahy_B05g079441 [Arachis hypogaea]|uniref:Ubiquitin-like protease family profile domain-containing protein n=1 Tax=Arachis hypogaea TaxID=3818 RepID=A0A444Z9U2_ARAHY|nr:hypothetical protein Ahy_B05g079441 [Arachis hypogaea]
MDKEQIKEPPSLVAPKTSPAPFAPRGSQSELPPNLANGSEHKRDSQETVQTMTTTFLVERLNQIEADIAKVRFIIRNQNLLNKEYVELVKEIINKQAVSPHIGSNSPKQGKTNMTEGNIGKSGPTLHTYKRTKNANPTTTGNDPDYLPIPTPPSSPDGSTFRFKRRNKQRRSGSTPAPKGETTRGRRKLFISGSISRIRHVDRSQWGKEIRKNIPRGMPLTFFPTKDMKIVRLDLCAAVYIFNTKLDRDELLVQSPHCAITSGALRTLEPRKPVVDHVLILLACMLARNSTRIHWFLPTTFSIYCPIWCNGHWFLLVIDIIRMQLMYLDSLPSEDDRPKRLRQLKKVTNPRILYSDYEIKEPKVTRQDPGRYPDTPSIAVTLKITEYSCMRLAVDMVLKYYNDKRMEVIQAALEYWRNLTTNSPATN